MNGSSSFCSHPAPTFSLNKMVVELGGRLLARGEGKLHSITDYCEGYA